MELVDVERELSDLEKEKMEADGVWIVGVLEKGEEIRGSEEGWEVEATLSSNVLSNWCWR